MGGLFEFIAVLVGLAAVAITTNLAIVGLADLVFHDDLDSTLVLAATELAKPEVSRCCKRKPVRRSRGGDGMTLTVIDLSEEAKKDELDDCLETTLLGAIKS